jgi:hypothetical protein
MTRPAKAALTVGVPDKKPSLLQAANKAANNAKGSMNFKFCMKTGIK